MLAANKITAVLVGMGLCSSKACEGVSAPLRITLIEKEVLIQSIQLSYREATGER